MAKQFPAFRANKVANSCPWSSICRTKWPQHSCLRPGKIQLLKAYCQHKVAAAAVEESPAEQIESKEEISRSMDNQSTESLYQQFDKLLQQTMQDYDLGDRVVGTVTTVDEKGAFIDVGSKAPAFLPLQEVTNFKVDKVNKVLQAGTDREFQVVYRNKNPRKGRHEIVVSLKEVERDLCWKRIQQYAEEKISIKAKADKEDGVEALVGKFMKFTILECDPEIDRLIVSARKNFSQMSSSQASYKVGDVVLGNVQSVQPYGAFLDLGNGMSGLLHISQISADRVKSIEDILSIGDKLKVMVLTQDVERGRLSLSTMKLEPKPGDMLRNPAVVFEKADEMAERFRQNIAEAEKSTMAWMQSQNAEAEEA